MYAYIWPIIDVYLLIIIVIDQVTGIMLICSPVDLIVQCTVTWKMSVQKFTINDMHMYIATYNYVSYVHVYSYLCMDMHNIHMYAHNYNEKFNKQPASVICYHNCNNVQKSSAVYSVNILYTRHMK